MSRSTTTGGSALALAACVLAGVTGLSVTGSSAATAPSATASPVVESRPSTQGEARGFLDTRRGTSTASVSAGLRLASTAARRPAARALQRSLGESALFDVDGSTGTPRLVAKLDGYLTGTSKRPAKDVALGFVRSHLWAFGLVAADLDTLRFRKDYVDISGVHHLSWTQTVGGMPVFGNGLQASVNSRGRLLTVGGAPVSATVVTRSTGRRLATSGQAISAARRDTGEASAAPGPRDVARRVLFVTRAGTHVGWQTVTMSAAEPAVSVLDADTGRTLFRQPLQADASGGDRHATGLAYPFFPGKTPRGGTQVKVDFTAQGWLGGNATRLSGNNSHAWSDVNDDDRAQSSEEAGPSAPRTWNHRLKPFHLSGVSFCDNPWPCSWNPDVPYSWRTNRRQNVTQVFYFVNRFHDHLLKAPIGFTESAGNFQRVNYTHKGKAGDAVDTQTDDGANTAAGLPDGAHIDNANMSTPPDGMRPTMQMYLQHQPGTTYPDGDPFAPTNVGDEADTVYHEYTHGLSNRLVVDARGISTLGGVQAGSMGEAWSDWYAMDYLVAQGLQADQKGKVDVVLFKYDGEGVYYDRTEPLDCKVGSKAARCNGGLTGHLGGYTYRDYAQVVGSPEVHSDGEIWAQSLWDLRDALGSAKTESLVTRAMELAPSNPSFLDMRNAILMADTAVFSGRDRTRIWQVFAHRGMGYYAGSLGGDDAAPSWDFHTPPASTTKAHIQGTVSDPGTGQPVAGIAVSLPFQGGNGVVNPTAVTDAQGDYEISGVPVGSYKRLVVTGSGYDRVAVPVTVTSGGAVVDFEVRRDWAASSGGASVYLFNGPDYGPECGPEQAIDGSQVTGWSSTTGDNAGTPTNVFVDKFVTVDLGVPVDVSEFGVDPSATCGDGGSASLGDYLIETSPDNNTWTPAQQGTFGVADRGRVNLLTPTDGAAGVRFVRLTMKGNQTPDFATSCPGGAYSGCSYTDLSELEVYGAPSAP